MLLAEIFHGFSRRWLSNKSLTFRNQLSQEWILNLSSKRNRMSRTKSMIDKTDSISIIPLPLLIPRKVAVHPSHVKSLAYQVNDGTIHACQKTQYYPDGYIWH